MPFAPLSRWLDRRPRPRRRALIAGPVLVVVTALLAGLLAPAPAFADERPRLATVADLDRAAVDLSAFSDREQAVAPMLDRLAFLANSVVDDDPETYGMIDCQCWRRGGDYGPDNARINENVLTLAYFYSTDRPWNPYYADPALKARLEAALTRLLELQDVDGSVPQGPGDPHSRPATGFFLLFVAWGTREHLDAGPGIDPALRDRLDAASVRAAEWFVTTTETSNPQARVLHNQIAGGLVAISHLISEERFAHLRPPFEERTRLLSERSQSPTGGYFYEVAAGHAYSIGVATHDLAMWGDAATWPTIVAGQQRYFDWLELQALPEPGGRWYGVNTATDARHVRFNEIEAMPIGANGLWTAHLPEAAAWSTTRDEVDARRTAWSAGTWTTSVGPSARALSTWFDPTPVLTLLLDEHYPSAGERTAAIAASRPVAEQRFTRHLTDDHLGQQHLFVRRPDHLVGLSFGPELRMPSGDYIPGFDYHLLRYGLNYLWHPAAGMLIQSQNRRHGTPTEQDTRAGELSWSTLVETDPGYRVEARGAVSVDVRGAEGGGDSVRATWRPAQGERWFTKRAEVDSDGVAVDVAVRGAFLEQVPLVIHEDDELTWRGPANAPTALEVRRGTVTMTVAWNRARSVELVAVDQAGCGCALFDGRSRLTMLQLHATNRLDYRIAVQG